MHRHRDGEPLSVLPISGRRAYLAQKTLLADLVIIPPAQGDSLSYLIDRLPLSPDAVEPALAALQAVGLAERRGDLARATTPAHYFGHLWPVAV